MNKSKLERDLKIVQRALGRDKRGYDADGYDSEGKDRYGRSRELMERAEKENQDAFDSLTPEQQALCWNAEEIAVKYEQKAVEWENQPLAIRKQSPFYEEYKAHSPITKHSCLFGVWVTPEEDKLCMEAATIMIRARNKLYPSGMHRSIH